MSDFLTLLPVNGKLRVQSPLLILNCVFVLEPCLSFSIQIDSVYVDTIIWSVL